MTKHAEEMTKVKTIIDNLENQIKELKQLLHSIAKECPKTAQCPKFNSFSECCDNK